MGPTYLPTYLSKMHAVYNSKHCTLLNQFLYWLKLIEIAIRIYQKSTVKNSNVKLEKQILILTCLKLNKFAIGIQKPSSKNLKTNSYNLYNLKLTDTTYNGLTNGLPYI